MNNDAQLVIDVWEAVRDNLPANKRSDTALAILRAFQSYGFEDRDIELIVDEDDDLEEAFYVVYHDGEIGHDHSDDEDFEES